MHRATRFTVLLCAVALVLVARSGAAPTRVERVNGIGMIDYSRRPHFQIGDWVSYHLTGSSQMGMRDDYDLTVIIAGEEVWWGDSCFWVETWTDAAGKPAQTTATLMSYSIFDDSMPIQRMQLYQRKTLTPDPTRTGSIYEDFTRPSSSLLQTRDPFSKPTQWDVDTLEADTVQTPMGLLHARRVSIRQGTGVTKSTGDSSVYDEVRDNRMSWNCPDVPITHIAREQVENIIARQTWAIGHSKDASPLTIRDKGEGDARLTGFGHGRTPRAVPADRRFGRAEPPAHPAARPGSAPARRR